MNDTFLKLKRILAPYDGVIRFLVVMFAANFVWKLAISDEDNVTTILLFNKYDISTFFLTISSSLTQLVYNILHTASSSVIFESDYILSYANGRGIRIIWGCTGIKQMFIFACILLFSKGSWKKKIWFIPLGLAICYVVNVIRITFLTYSVEDYFDYFNLLHNYISKYFFYAIIFLLWLWWEERIRVDKNLERLNQNNSDCESSSV